MSAIEISEGGVPPAERNAIGLSFGNSNSSISYTTGEGKAEVIANQEGDRQIPSILSYVDGEEYHGTQAKSHLVRNSKNTVAYFRDFLGKNFKSIDPTACHASAHPQEHDSTVAFSIHETESETPSTLTVSEIATRHLRRLRSAASEFMGKDINAAVVTVPTDFTDKQREALTSASKNAGIDVLQLIHEPVAAMLAYDARPESKISDKIVVVADLGGTRSDVAVCASRGGIYSILATAHDYSLGGAQLDQVLIDFFSKEFLKKHKEDPRENARSLAKLKLEVEGTKKSLSLGANASLSVESLANGIDFSSSINRSRYELLASKVFGGFTRLVEGAVQKAGLDVLHVDEVILSGGTSHTPKIARSFQSVFPASTILAPSTFPTAINPSELTARGAAIQASLVQEFEQEDIEQSIHPMVTVTPHLPNAIGVVFTGTEGDEKATFRPLLEGETAVPARRTALFDAPASGGDVLIRVCEGIREISVTKPETQPKTNGKAKTSSENESDDEDDSDDEEEEIRNTVWKVGKTLAEAAVRGVTSAAEAGAGASKKKQKKIQIEVMANVAADLSVQITAREVGGKGGVRGGIEKAAIVENGSA
ncbi:MAG: exosome non-catalytic core subunit rrp40 [Chaenotheca gracillima]|nr:MAG: exosome non-catalytic core subunit rrp40 [Chaenotheca gracillima]